MESTLNTGIPPTSTYTNTITPNPSGTVCTTPHLTYWSSEIIIGNYTFDVDTLGHLLNLLLNEHPELQL